MKIKNVLFVLAIVIIAASSCTNKQKSQQDQVQEFRSQLTYNDTTAMLQMCDNAMELLKQQKYDEVIASLYVYDDSTKSVSSLSEITANSYRRMFEMFPVLEFEREYFSFLLEGCNDVKYNVTFNKVQETGEALKTAYMFNPVKIAGEWKLCVKTVKDANQNSINMND